MRARQVEALRAAAHDGVDTDGLVVTHVETDGYTLAVPESAHERLSDADLDRVAREHADYVTNWWFFSQPRSDHGQAFLRWLEGADEHPVPERYDALREGVSRSWGQLQITVTLGEDGDRRYDIRHEADDGVAVDALEPYDDPLDARSLSKYDDRGRYRPLKTAPTLQTGWVYSALDADAMLETIGFLYPATVANWHRERTGELDVTHWRETAERQTGIYAIVEELAGEQVEWVAESCCADSQCVKRRLWDEDDETLLDVPRGDGEFPCREPCSLVVAAARKWTTLERADEHEYTLRLTESELEQLEALVESVAEGRVDEIREADVYEGANRYRARFLRAKRFDDDGGFADVRVATHEGTDHGSTDGADADEA